MRDPFVSGCRIELALDSPCSSLAAQHWQALHFASMLRLGYEADSNRLAVLIGSKCEAIQLQTFQFGDYLSSSALNPPRFW